MRSVGADITEPVRWGVLSTARINDKVLAGARHSEQVTVLAVASRDQARADAYARERAIPRGYGSYDALLADPDIEAVYISLPNAMHVDWSIRALEAGKHVLCEKPLSGSSTEVARAFDAAERAGRFLMEAFMYRHNPQTTRLAALLRAGAIGTARILRASFSFPLGDPTDPRMLADLEGGSLMDVGCYCVNAARFLLGEPVRASGEQILGPGGVDVAFAGVLAFAGGVVAHFDSGLLFPSVELAIYGDEGSLHVADPWQCRRAGIERRSLAGDCESIAIEAADSYGLQLDDLSAAIRGRHEPLLGRADSAGQARAIEALYASAAEHRVVTL